MSDALFWHRVQFAFTIIYHYLFPQLTMGLALLIVIWKWKALRSDAEGDHLVSRFWIRLFGLNFAFGVATGIPMEFQFGTNWANFSKYAGGVIGQTLALEGLFAFFLESSFLALLIFGEKKLSKRAHFATAVALFLGSWMSGYFIVTTNAFMQHPVGYGVNAEGNLYVQSFAKFLLNPWALIQYAHNMMASVVTASFVTSAISAFWILRGNPDEKLLAENTWKVSLRVGLVAAVLVAFPTGDMHAKMVAEHQPAALAAMEGRFRDGPMAELSFIGQPNVAERRLDNPIHLPGALSFLAFGSIHRSVRGLDSFPEDQWPTNIELLYYAFHVMAGLGTLFILLMTVCNFMLWKKKLATNRSLLWTLMLAFPFPYIATIAGWMVAELGRQPWLVYGIFRTAQGASPNVHSGDALFTLIGFCGLYFVMFLLYTQLFSHQVFHPISKHGPKDEQHV